MKSSQERQEREERAARLKEARKNAGFRGPKALEEKFGWNINNYKAHESGRNGFGLADAKEYAKAFGVSLNWLNFGQGEPDDIEYDEIKQPITVPLVSWVSAGQMSEQSPVVNFDEYPPIETAGLHKGNWIALRVTGDSMNKISPPDSIIFVDLDDRNLVPNALYVISDEEGHATYKRYRPSETPPFQPASYHDVGPPCIKGAAKVIGRVRRSVIDC